MERGYSNKERAAVSTGVEKLDNCLGGKGLRLGRVHEIINTGSTDAKDASSLGFVVALLVRILNVTNYNKRVLWCSGKKKVLNSNQKTILLVIYNSQNQRRYIGVKLD